MKTLTCLVALASLPAHVSALWPIPRQLSTGNSSLRLANSFSIQASFSAPSDLDDAIARALGFLKSDKLAPLTIDRGASLAGNASNAPALSALVLSLGGGEGKNASAVAGEAVKAVGARDEAYVLHVPADGSDATLEANSTLGLFRGLTTFGQLWYTVGEQTFTSEAPVAISDTPAFPFRGFMLDTARNFFPVSDIKRTLDAMSWVKLNQFHWHVVDSQSFALQVPGFPELSAAAAYAPSAVYSPSDVSDIVAYAAARGIDVLIEVDTPGHTSAIARSHPEHVACAGATPWANFAAEPPAGQLRLTSAATANFTAGLLAAVARMFPSTLFSTGGDEVNALCYEQDGETQRALNETGKTIEQALDAFTGTTHAALRSLGKTPVVWEEMVLDHNVTLANDTITMVWISSDDVRAVADKGFRIVHAASDYFYLDCGAGGWVGDNVDRWVRPSPLLSSSLPPYYPILTPSHRNSWCDPFKTWQKSYSFDPYANLSTAQHALVLGGEALLWTEQSGPQNLDPIVWPRAAAGAEVFWTGATLPDGGARVGNATDGGDGDGVEKALPRLHDLAFRMRERGVNAISLQPLWCALRPGTCDLTA